MSDPNNKISELTNTAIKLSEIDYNIPFKRYLRASKEIIRTADYYLQDDHLENAFILYSKYCTLFVEKYPKHPEYKNFSPKEKKIYSVTLKDSFKKAEDVKQKLLVLYKKEYEEKKKNQEEYRLVVKDKKQSDVVELKIDALGERGVGLEDNENKKKQTKEEEMNAFELRFQRMKSQVELDEGSLRKDSGSHEVSDVNSEFSESTGITPSAPQLEAPRKEFKLKPAIDRSLKPSIANIPTGLTNSVLSESVSAAPMSGLRNVIIPSNLASVFLTSAKPNSDKNVETCGILLGDLFQNKWKITRILVPQQIGGSDTCDIINDEEMVVYQDEHNLITLGWIHTHPSQTAFLSSVDQHTHWPYQKLFPEAIAVVCSPKYNETGYFNLSPEGMQYIQGCKGRGFHQHPTNPPLFQNCQHAEFDLSYSIVLHDLRR